MKTTSGGCFAEVQSESDSDTRGSITARSFGLLWKLVYRASKRGEILFVLQERCRLRSEPST